jgi:hypothetical protein
MGCIKERFSSEPDSELISPEESMMGVTGLIRNEAE